MREFVISRDTRQPHKEDSVHFDDTSNTSDIDIRFYPLSAGLETLSSRERLIIELRGEEKTLAEVGLEIGVTLERIRAIEAKAESKIRRSVASRRFRDDLS